MISKTITLPNGALAQFHYVGRLNAVYPLDNANLSVLSYPTEEAFLSGSDPIWSTPLVMPLVLALSLASVEGWLITSADSPFLGGSIVMDQRNTLNDAKSRLWGRVKQARAVAIDSPLTTPFGVFDSDAKSRAFITDAVLLLQTLADAGTPQTIDFTLADNSVVTLGLEQMVTVGLLLGQKVQAVYTHCRALRAAIEALTTVEAVEAYDLTVGWP